MVQIILAGQSVIAIGAFVCEDIWEISDYISLQSAPEMICFSALQQDRKNLIL